MKTKFHLYNMESKKMIPEPHNYFLSATGEVFCEYTDGRIEERTKQTIILSFTGEIDRNYKEVYFYDIVRFRNFPEESEPWNYGLVDYGVHHPYNPDDSNAYVPPCVGFFIRSQDGEAHSLAATPFERVCSYYENPSLFYINTTEDE